MKTCSKCKIEKDESYFYKSNKMKDGLSYWCKSCCKTYRENNKENYKKYYENNADKIKTNRKEYCKNNVNKIKKNNKEYYKNNIDKFKKNNKEYYKNNADELKKSDKEYYRNNIDEIKIKQKEYSQKESTKQRRKQRRKERITNDSVYKMRDAVSKSIYKMLKKSGNSKSDESVLKYLPYTILELKKHLENLFDENMNWNNHGSYWHLDHIYPQSKLPYDSMRHPNFQKCWALSNLQPLEVNENLKKSNKLDWKKK